MLFALYGLVDKRSAEAPEKIVVSASRIENLSDGFARTWRRPPSKEELKGLIEDYIRDEVFYRAGRGAGLDRDDVVIRRRVRQKMEFLVEEISAPEPTEAQLAAVLTSNPERFRTEDRLTFHQLFLNPSRRTGTIDRDLEQVRALKYPVFTGSTICSHGYCHMLHLGLPIRVGGLMVNQGDLLHGDANGVTNIPLEIASEVADAAGEFLAAEEIVMSYVKSRGEKSVAKYNDLRKQFQATVAALTKRVARKS